jgi:PTS system mannose-specific IIA component
LEFIIASHGRYALETKKSCEMIAGYNDKIHVVTFLENMSVAMVIEKYEQILAGLGNQEILIIVDLKGGTPCNAAVMAAERHANVKVVTGLSLAMILSLSLGESLDQTLSDLKENTKVLSIDRADGNSDAAGEEDEL